MSILTGNRIALAAILTFFVGTATAQWTDGQNALFVVGQSNFTNSSANLTQSGLNRPYAVAIDVTNGKLYVSDENYHRITRYAWPITGNGPNAELVFGQTDFTSGSGNQGSTTAADTLLAPRGISVDSSGNLWVADAGNNRVLRYSSAHATASNGPNADLVIGQTNFTDNAGGNGAAELSDPEGVLVDPSGILWVSSTAANKVLEYGAASGLSTGASAVGVLGQTSIGGSTGATSQAGLQFPTALAMNGTTLYVSDGGNHRIMRWDNAATVADSDGANADGVLGQATFATNASGLSASAINLPFGVATDGTGRLYIADNNNRRVVTHDAAAGKSDGATADNVLGQPDFDTANNTVTQNGMGPTLGVAADSTNDLLAVGMAGGRRVLIFEASVGIPVELSHYMTE